jgi:hypothetical protein
MASLLRHTVWHPDALDPDEWKFRALKRVWLPVFDLLAILASIWAVAFGSPILNRLFGEGGPWVNVLGSILFVSSVICLAGVIFPVLWRVEIAAKIALMSLLAGYGTLILLMSSPPDWFPAIVILMTLPLPLFRLGLLGEEIKERRVADPPKEG